MFSACPCCLPTEVIILFCSAFIISYVAKNVLSKFFPEQSILKKILQGTTYTLAFGVGAIAIFLGILAQNPVLNQKFFAKLCLRLSKSPHLDEIRCELLKNVEGRVLEIGPGPGTNFRCLKHNSKITEWVGVEPNVYFQESIEQARVTENISFPVRTVWLKGENVDVDPSSFDYVIGTHVLCSIDDMQSVLHQVDRALKPGGQYIFLEHVAAPEGTNLRLAQNIFDPLFRIFAAGCRFKTIWEQISSTNLKNFTIDMTHFSAPIGIPLIVPHIRGFATKNA